MGLCLHAGVPQIVRPGFGDQFDNIARLIKLGCGIEIAINSFTSRQLIEAIKLISHVKYQGAAKILQAKIHNEPSFEDNFKKIFSAMCKLREAKTTSGHKNKFYADSKNLWSSIRDQLMRTFS
jgi:UDP:flavonoid glycosyltransferase YjiC (YdhE family)